MTKDTFKQPMKVIRLWKHECERVFRDRLVSDTDLEKYDEFLNGTLKTWFKEEPLDQVQAIPNLFTSFMDHTSDDMPLYNQARHTQSAAQRSPCPAHIESMSEPRGSCMC
jgi:dynein heavy chain, axonemal